jgi:probable rRNA maturation factor
MIHFQIAEMLEQNRVIPPGIRSVLEHAAEETLAQASEPVRADVSLVLTDDLQLQELNRTYLGIDSPTDVLAFPSGEVDPETDNLYLGDVILSLPRAEAQAAQGAHALEAELQLLVVHGMLHLCGFDHFDAQSQAVMWEKQRQILRSLGCPIEGPPDAES